MILNTQKHLFSLSEKSIYLNGSYMSPLLKTVEEIGIKAIVNKGRRGGFFIEDQAYRGHHLFGIYLPKSKKISTIKKRLAKQQIYVSHRGNSIRVSPNVYNTKEDLKKLVACFI